MRLAELNETDLVAVRGGQNGAPGGVCETEAAAVGQALEAIKPAGRDYRRQGAGYQRGLPWTPTNRAFRHALGNLRGAVQNLASCYGRRD
jgi:hypothetical protein